MFSSGELSATGWNSRSSSRRVLWSRSHSSAFLWWVWSEGQTFANQRFKTMVWWQYLSMVWAISLGCIRCLLQNTYSCWPAWCVGLPVLIALLLHYFSKKCSCFWSLVLFHHLKTLGSSFAGITAPPAADLCLWRQVDCSGLCLCVWHSCACRCLWGWLDVKDQIESLDGACKSGEETRWSNPSRGGGQFCWASFQNTWEWVEVSVW